MSNSSSMVPGWERLVRHLQRHNLFYLLSALLMLLGCYLISVPYLVSLNREASGLLMLLGTINLYEALVILACGFICRQAPRSREGSTLLLVALLFLLDVTFTINACLPVGRVLGIAVGSFSFVLALFKMYALERGARFPIFKEIRVFLTTAVLFLYSFQGLLGLYPEGTPAWKQAASCAVWTLYGLLPLLLWNLPLPRTKIAWAEPHAEPWWQSDRFRRTAIVITMGLLALQIAGAAWVHEAPCPFVFLIPLVIACTTIVPFFFREQDHAAILLMRIWTVATLLLLCGSLGSDIVWTPGLEKWRVTLTPFRIDCLVAALSFLLLRLREKTPLYLDLACGCLGLAAASHNMESLMRLLFREPPLAATVACVLVGAVWLLTRVTFRRALFFWLCSLVLVVRMLHSEQLISSALLEISRWAPLGLLALCLMFGRGAKYARAALIAWIWLWGVWSCDPSDLASLVYFYAAAGVMIAGCALSAAIFLPALLAFLLAANASAFGTPLPSRSSAWGWLAILLAFACLGIAFQITRKALQEATAPAQISPDKPHA